MYSVDITLENAQQLLIDESLTRLVLVSFGSESNAACTALTSILESLANEYQGEFLLAKVNTDKQDVIASQFGIRNLPTLMLIKNGQPLDGLVGAQTETSVRQLMEKYLPKSWEKDFQKAQALLMEKDFAAALPLLRQVYKASKQQAGVAISLAQALVELQRIEEAEELLNTIKPIDQTPDYEQILAYLNVKKQAVKIPEIIALELAHKQSPENLDIAYTLAILFHQEKQSRPALELLVDILRRDRSFSEGAAKKMFTDILAELGKSDPLAIEYQRKLFTLLY